MLKLIPVPCSLFPVLLRFLVRLVLAAAVTELLELQAPRGRLLVLRRRVVPLLALRALQCNDFPHPQILPVVRDQRSVSSSRCSLFPIPCYLTISETVPAPTARPPSRIAKR